MPRLSRHGDTAFEVGSWSYHSMIQKAIVKRNIAGIFASARNVIKVRSA